MTKLTTALAALVAVSTLAPAALADQSSDIASTDITARVSTAGLDLNSPVGAQEFLARIQDAAKEACHDPRSAIKNMERKCRNQIVSDNVARLNNNALGVAFTDVYGEKPALARR